MEAADRYVHIVESQCVMTSDEASEASDESWA